MTASTETMTARITGVDHVSLTVSDVARSQAWYEQVLGFRKVMDHAHESGTVAVLQEPTSGAGLGLNQHRGHAGERFSEVRTGLDHLSFRVESRSALDEWAGRLDELGVQHADVVDVHDPFSFAVLTFRDPDGIALELISWESR